MRDAWEPVSDLSNLKNRFSGLTVPKILTIFFFPLKISHTSLAKVDMTFVDNCVTRENSNIERIVISKIKYYSTI